MPRRFVKKMDNLFWGLAGGSQLALAAGSFAGQVFLSVGTIPSTLLRIRGTVLAFIDGVQAPGVLNSVTWGIIKVDEGAGSTSRYDPVADSNAPWLAYGTFLIGHEEMVTDVLGGAGLDWQRHVVDNKAMRRIRVDQEVQISVSNVALAGSAPINFAFALRVLQGF